MQPKKENIFSYGLINNVTHQFKWLIYFDTITESSLNQLIITNETSTKDRSNVANILQHHAILLVRTQDIGLVQHDIGSSLAMRLNFYPTS